MYRSCLTLILLISLAVTLTAQSWKGPEQPLAGPGGRDYVGDSVLMYDFAQKPYGYWLFEPGGATRPDSAQVIVLIHGYGGYNPMIYGEWIEHLVRKGNLVIFPRYQRNLFCPRPKRFGDYCARAIRDALTELEKAEHVRPKADHLIIAGHSYGGVVTADLGVNFREYKIPRPKALLLCSPGTGPFKGGRLKTYEAMPADTKLVIMAGEGDWVVGDEFARLVFETAVHTPERNLIYQYRDPRGIGAGHSQSYAIDLQFDTGRRNPTARRALRRGPANAVDYYGYWKILDGLISCVESGHFCRYALGDTLEQGLLGYWSDGRPVKPLEVIVPE